ncbi:TPA: hypothetical protein N0F65_011280 [Lagenidium giganteum]|uniref:Ubiquitin-like modifier-activating enzyme ATG7 n=1 Tax=Lagenidium giganteum TaxID=4803 RepID=A0AAV2YT01_9STRA|nr:TPA: hypothetical protein N0F65_011280 [Lagenidium giganteum]
MATPAGDRDAGWHVLKFQPWSSAPDVSFWQRLATLKLDKFQLNDQAQPLVAYFCPGRSASVPARLCVDDSSFASETARSVDRERYEWKAPGLLVNTNTLEAFKTLDKQALLNQTAEKVVHTVRSGGQGGLDALNAFVLCTFADLKKHTFLYWFGFPAVVPNEPFVARTPVAVVSVLSAAERSAVIHGLFHLRQAGCDGTSAARLTNFPSYFVVELLQQQDQDQSEVGACARVLTWQDWSKDVRPSDVKDTLFGFVDPCALATNPGWPMRNYLALLAALPDAKIPSDRPLKLLSFREHTPDQLEHLSELQWKQSLVFEVQRTASHSTLAVTDNVKIVGWEANARGKLGPRIMELGSILDPLRLAEQSVDLNLKLMMWRQLPTLNLDKLATTKCLLLGAGTLGCYTARCLLSWGFRHITLVDNSTVSHSNPVRQPLFEFADCGKPKAECAAKALKRVFPLVQSDAVELSIPMAGHALSNQQLLDDARARLTKLEELIEGHDVVFLGTDSRESRWLPTVICAAKEKVLINAALGFDSYLVMRHGVPHRADSRAAELGCYFCNDVVSPRDSLKDRTLDQMCTVTRPGLAPIASATAVELLVAVLHSKDGGHVSAEPPTDTAQALAFVPHQLRGFLNGFNSVVVKGEHFNKCIACSAPVLDAYDKDAFGLLQNACNQLSYLEDLTGLSELTNAVEDGTFEVDFAGSEDDDEDALC